MTDFRKLRAVVQLGLVSAIFWGVAAVVGRIGYDLLYAVLGARPFAGMFSFPWLLTRFFLPGAIIGFAGGAIYAAAIALTPRAVGDQSLSGKRAAAFGALGGIVVFIAIRLTLLSDSTAGLMVVPTLVFAGLGAATGLGILGTAKRAALRPGEEPPNSIAP